MNDIVPTRGIRTSWLLMTALLYLLLPNVLFLFGWVRPEFAVPISASLLLAVVWVWRRSADTYVPAGEVIALNRRNVGAIIALAFVALVLTEIIAIHGHSFQHPDCATRNALYDLLIHRSWPLYSDGGDYFVYYHAFWLPPALAAKYLCGIVSSNTLLFVWSFWGIFLTLLLAYCRLRSKIVLFLVILCMHESLPFAYHYLRGIVHLQPEWLFPDPCAWFPHYCYCFHQLGNTYNHAIPGGLCLMLLLGRMLPVKYYLLPAGLLCSHSPMLALALLPFLFIVFMRHLIKYRIVPFNFPTIAGSALVLVVGLYMSAQMSSGDTGLSFMWAAEPPFKRIPAFNDASFRIILSFVIFLSCFVPLYFLTERRLRQTSVFIASCFTCAMITFVCIGINNNELLFKGSLFIAVSQAILWSVQWKYLSRCRRIVLLAFIVIPNLPYMCYSLQRIAVTYSWNSERMAQNIKYLDVHYPGCPYYQTFWRTYAPSPLLFKRQTLSKD